MKKNDTESEKKRIIKWHHTFGVTLIDYFTHSNYKVDLEKEVSLKKQYLDIAIIRKVAGTPLKEIATGLETLIEYNLFTYKSLREALDRWAIEELIGYYSNYRKIISPSLQKLLPESQFKLYAICTRYPEKLFGNKDLKKEQVDTGLYDITWGARIIQIIVLSQISKKKHNALWQLFSGNSDGFIFGNEHYNWQCPEEKAALNQLFDLYKQEGAKMPYNMIEFTKEFTREHLHLLPHRDRLHGMSAGEVVKQFSVHDVVTQFSTGDRLHGMSAGDRLHGMSAGDRLHGMSAGDRLQGMSAKDIEEYLKTLKK